MNQKQYLSKLKKLERRYQFAVTQAQEDFAISNNKNKKGDIITDKIGSIRIDKMEWTIPIGYDLPCMLYFGRKINNKGKLKITSRAILQKDLIKKKSKK